VHRSVAPNPVPSHSGGRLAAPQIHGLIAHRWYGADGEFMAIDEWPDAESFQAFFDEAQPDIGPVMRGQVLPHRRT
jgi:hypothetical protein